MSVTGGHEHDDANTSVADNFWSSNGLNSNDAVIKTEAKTNSSHVPSGAITINVNGEHVDTINDADIMSLITPAMPLSQVQESESSTFDALINDMSPNAPSCDDFTPSPEVPSLSYFGGSFSTGSPSESAMSPEFDAFNGPFEFDFSLGPSDSKVDAKTIFTEPLLFSDDFVDLDPFTTGNVSAS